ncbi:hypothetical protein SVAN01_06192 [Stagonosporopsis vannaccii]|nr:hypothetical protein SVAN01_06192 [Stagonosporopsis vannaccii]
MHEYIPVESVSRDDSSLLTMPEEPSEQLELERPKEVHFDVKPAESAQGLLSKIYCAVTGGRAPGCTRPVQQERTSASGSIPNCEASLENREARKPVLKNKATALGKKPTSKIFTRPALSTDFEDEDALEAMSQSMVLNPGNEELALEATMSSENKGKGKLVAARARSHDYHAERVPESNVSKENVSRTAGLERVEDSIGLATRSQTGDRPQPGMPHAFVIVRRPEFLVKHFDVPVVSVEYVILT